MTENKIQRKPYEKPHSEVVELRMEAPLLMGSANNNTTNHGTSIGASIQQWGEETFGGN